eukprot:CAMPEP_0194108470 /NCGR_PEP_ID=MMETSP0150-20130528/8143_1 /TAXON_ID=122233 /ORGANISM="Chaetoceros debilis, Strain MM31A-1" /LENGTH=251 /DNA_ID=CAMNT_0038797169 /DNA_START=68 /DNA_END=819 /DNA_ORIENTATION=-
MANMESIPDVVLMKIFDFLPPHAYLPYAHVSTRFRLSWVEMRRAAQAERPDSTSTEEDEAFKTNPMTIGNLFHSSWAVSSSSGNNPNVLNIGLLKYYVENEYGSREDEEEDAMGGTLEEENHTDSEGVESFDTPISSSRSTSRTLRKVMYETAMRGDIRGMSFIITNRYCLLNNTNICTMAGAAGQLEALQWLRGDIQIDGAFDTTQNCCPWDPTELHREAAENAQFDIIDYVERNSPGRSIQVHYGVGLP